MFRTRRRVAFLWYRNPVFSWDLPSVILAADRRIRLLPNCQGPIDIGSLGFPVPLRSWRFGLFRMKQPHGSPEAGKERNVGRWPCSPTHSAIKVHTWLHAPVNVKRVHSAACMTDWSDLLLCTAGDEAASFNRCVDCQQPDSERLEAAQERQQTDSGQHLQGLQR